MIAGVGCALKSWRPGTKVIAVQADGAPAMVESWRSGHVVEHETMNTIADGVGVRVPIPEAVEDMRAVVDDAVLVREQTILRAMRLLHRRAGVVVEPSGAVGLAAILERPEMFRGATVATIVGGGNVTPEQMDRWL
jgi:threonine dehydratase